MIAASTADSSSEDDDVHIIASSESDGEFEVQRRANIPLKRSASPVDVVDSEVIADNKIVDDGDDSVESHFSI